MDEPYPKWRSDRPPPLLAPEPSEPHFVRTERPHAHGVKRVLKVVGAIAGTGVTFVVATAAGALLHVGLPPARRLAAAGARRRPSRAPPAGAGRRPPGRGSPRPR